MGDQQFPLEIARVLGAERNLYSFVRSSAAAHIRFRVIVSKVPVVTVSGEPTL